MNLFKMLDYNERKYDVYSFNIYHTNNDYENCNIK